MLRHVVRRRYCQTLRSAEISLLSSRSGGHVHNKRPISVASRRAHLPYWIQGLPRAESRRTIAGLPAQDDTIYALSSAQGKAGIAVIRISGPACLNVYRALCPSLPLPKPRYATLRTLLDPGSSTEANILDANALVLYFPSPKTVTGEDILELHVHGGPATVKAVLSAIPRCWGSPVASAIRYAEPGEFTKRAFFNDRLDLAQVEALSDTLAAETEQQRRAAVRGNSGALGRTYEAWRQRLLLARGEIEALIDFSEDQHFDESPAELLGNVSRLVREIVTSIRAHEAAGQRAELLRGGIRVALVGPPNAGKSSLMNLIVGREASIVSQEAGTTRDIVEASLDIRGYLCSFADTAGFRGLSTGPVGAVEMEGIRRAKQKALDSDVIIVLASVEVDAAGRPVIRYDEETLQLAGQAEQRLVVINKCDSVNPQHLAELLEHFRSCVLARFRELGNAELALVSCKDAALASVHQPDPGRVGTLIDSLVATFSGMTSLPEDRQDLLGVTERQRQLLAECRGYLEDFLEEAPGPALPESAEDEPDIVMAAEHLRYAANCLARITGRGEGGDVEEVLGVIFEK